MRYFALLSAVWICAASGCTSTDAHTATELVGFTFRTDKDSFASFGSSGAFHDILTPTDAQFGVKITQCDGDVCRFEGPIDVSGDVSRRRCETKMSQTCNSDADCPQSKGCVYIYEAPVATRLHGADNKYGACGWTYIPLTVPAPVPDAPPLPGIRGTLNLTTNNLILDNLPVTLALNEDGPASTTPRQFHGLCGECVGDPTPNDGKKQGTCMQASPMTQTAGDKLENVGPGIPCDVNRAGLNSPYTGNYSMDCAPTAALDVLRMGDTIDSQGKDIEITDRSPDCSDGTTNGTTKCFCGMCSNTMMPTACMSNDDCPSGGTCGNTQTPKVLASSCPPTSPCVWSDSAGIGTCDVSTTDPITHVTTVTTLKCYPSGTGKKISVRGTTDRIGEIFYAHTGGARCIAAGPDPQFNRDLGLPGLLFQKRNFKITPTYTEVRK